MVGFIHISSYLLFVGFSKIAKSYIAGNGEERKHGVNDVTTIIYTL